MANSRSLSKGNKMLKKQPIHGCCQLTNLYDLGHAHGREILDFVQFCKQLKKMNLAAYVMAVTNGNQKKELDFMSRLGFKHQKLCGGYLTLSTVDRKTLFDNVNKELSAAKPRRFGKTKEKPQEGITDHREWKPLRKRYWNTYVFNRRNYSDLHFREAVQIQFGVDITTVEARDRDLDYVYWDVVRVRAANFRAGRPMGTYGNRRAI